MSGSNKCRITFIAGILLLFFLQFNTHAQESWKEKVDFKGYLKYLSAINFQDVDEDWLTDQLLHNRRQVLSLALTDHPFDIESAKAFSRHDEIQPILAERPSKGHESLVQLTKLARLEARTAEQAGCLLGSLIEQSWLQATILEVESTENALLR